MRSKLYEECYKEWGYSFSRPAEDASRRKTCTERAMFIFEEWINGRELTESYQDAICAMVKMYGDGVKLGCKSLYIASLDRVKGDPDQRQAYFDQGMRFIEKFFRRNAGALHDHNFKD